MSVKVRLDQVEKTLSRGANDTTLAMNRVSLEIETGELFFLLGPSGCGKSTCLRTIAGFYQPDSGQLFFDDNLMNDVPPHKRNTGMVFQNYALWPHMTVAQNIEYGLNLRKIDKETRTQKVADVLQIVKMEEYADRPVNAISGGQQQRIALARAIVIEPDVLLLDEPLSNLDAKLRLELRNEIKRIHGHADITAIYVTHDQSEALSLADRIAVMCDGVIIQVGTPQEIYRQPINTFVANFIGETNFVQGQVMGKTAEFLQIETPLGNLRTRISQQHNFKTGENVYCSIRPEAIKFGNVIGVEPADTNLFQAFTQDIIYLGQIEEYELAVGPSPSTASEATSTATLNFKAILYNPSYDQRPSKANDQPIFCYVAPEDVIVLPSEEPGPPSQSTTNFDPP
jgi:iron(III) transport system ATP-binding protein